MRARLAGLAAWALLLAGCASSSAVTSDEPLAVAAAADLRPAFTLLGERFEEETGEEITFVFGSSGQLAQQLVEGAPFDLFASADVAYIDEVLEAGRGDPGTRTTYAHGRIVVWADEARWADWADHTALASDAGADPVAIANPEHAPYGRAAREALESAGVWRDIEPRLVYGENIADTQRLAASGNADAAVVALSLALAADEDGDGRWVLIDEAAHEPLVQDLLVVADDPRRAELAGAFVAYLDGDDGREVMRRYGFLLPGEAPPEAWEPSP